MSRKPHQSCTSEDSRGSVSSILLRAAESDESAVVELWQRYFPKLVSLAHKTFAHVPHRIEDANDVAQNAMVSFWKQISGKGIAASLDRNSLWKLLTTITVRKVRGQFRQESAQKRGGGRIKPFSELSEDDSLQIQALLTAVPSEQFDMACEEWLNLLTNDLRQFAILRLFGSTNKEIATDLDCTERKVERKLNRIRSVWREAIEAGKM